MRKQKKSVLVLAVMAVFMATAMFSPGLIGAGELAPADQPGPSMRTLEEIDNNLNVLEYKLNQLLCIQGGDDWITYYGDDDGDGYGDPNVTWEGCQPPDGYVENDTDCNDEDALINPGACDIADNDIDEDCDGTALIASEWRFVDQCNGTVLDTVTELVWLKNANCFGEKNGFFAMKTAEDLEDGSQCGLTDWSKPGDWRLPTFAEWEAFVDTRFQNPALSNAAGDDKWLPGDAFNNVQSDFYWSSTPHGLPNLWGGVDMSSGIVGYENKGFGNYVWPVR